MRASDAPRRLTPRLARLRAAAVGNAAKRGKQRACAKPPPAEGGRTEPRRPSEDGKSFLFSRPRAVAIGCGERRPLAHWLGAASARRSTAAAWFASRTGEAAVRRRGAAPPPPRSVPPTAARRYVLCEVLSEDPRCRQCIEDRAVGLAVRDAIARAHGDYGLGCCCVSFTGSGPGRGGLGGAGRALTAALGPQWSTWTPTPAPCCCAAARTSSGCWARRCRSSGTWRAAGSASPARCARCTWAVSAAPPGGEGTDRP